jgi:hypothetical protein
MKVKLAVQVPSQSISDGIDFCGEKLQLPRFKGSEVATVFPRNFDILFNLIE